MVFEWNQSEPDWLGRSCSRKKHALEEQEEQLRKLKEHLQLEAEIAASMAKVNALRSAGLSRMSAASKKVDGMESYFEKGLNAHAETFLPHRNKRDGRGQLMFEEARAEQSAKAVMTQPESSMPTKSQITAPNDVAPPVSHSRNTNVSSSNSCEHNIISIQ